MKTCKKIKWRKVLLFLKKVVILYHYYQKEDEKCSYFKFEVSISIA